MDLMMRFTWKKLRLPPIACLALAVAAPVSTTPVRGQGRDAAAEARERFIGSWRLLWLEEQGPGGKVHRVEANGLLVFTREGHMSVQVMYRNPPSTASAGQVQYSQGGYEASFGRYEIDERARSFNYHVEGALVRNLVGQVQTRLYELSGKQLVVKSSNPNEHWRVGWEHY